MKIFVRLGLFCAICVGLFAFRHYLIGTALELAIPRITGESVVYRSRTWEEGKLVYHGFGLGDQFQAEKASFECNFHLFPLSVEPRIRFVKPLIQLDHESSSAPQFGFLIPSKFLAVKLDVVAGSIMSREGTLYPFEFTSGTSREEIGTLRLQDLMTCSLFLCDKDLGFNLEMQDTSLQKMVPLLSQFYSVKKLDGSITTQLQGKIGSQSFKELQGQCAFKNFHFESQETIFALDDLVGQVDFDGDFQTLILNADFKGADLFWKELEILRARGSLVFQPTQKPFFEIHGGVHFKNLEGQADIIGHGEIHPGGPLWLQGKIDYVTQSAPMSIDFSWVDEGVSQVLQTDLHNLGHEVLKQVLPFKSGVINAKLTTFFDHFVYQKTEINHLKAKDVKIDQISIHQIEAQGLVNLLAKNIESLSFQAQEVQGQYEGWNITGLHASVKMNDNTVEPSSAFGKIENIPVSIEFQGPLSKIHATAKFAAGASEWLNLPKNPAEPPILADLTLELENQKLDVAGKLTCIDDQLDLKATANLAQKKWAGSFQGTLFSAYDPFLKIVFPHAKLRGEVGVKGVFSNETVEAVLQGHEMTLEVLGAKASLPGQSRKVRVRFDCTQKSLEVGGEFSSLIISQGETNTAIEGGEFSFNNHLLMCKNLSGQLFFHNYQADFVGDVGYDTVSQQLNLDHLEGTLTAPIGEKIDFRCKHIQHVGSDWSFDAEFFQNSQTLLTLQGSGREISQGYDFVLKEAVASGSYLKTPLSLRWHLGKIESAQGVLFLQIDNLAHQLRLLDRFGVFSLSKDTEELIKQLQGNLVLHVDHRTSHADFSIEATDISYDTIRIELMKARLHQEGSIWTLSHCQLDEMKCKGEALQQGDKWVIPALDLSWKDLSLHTTGRFEDSQFHFDVKGGWKNRYNLQGQGILAARLLSHFSLKLLDQQEPLAEMTMDELSYRMEKWESPSAKLKLFSKHFAQSVQSDLLVSLSRSGCTFQGPFTKGTAILGKSELKLGQLFVLYEAPYLHFKCTAALDGEPLQFIGKFSEQFAGGVHIQQGSDLLKLTLSDPTTVQKVEGELVGVSMNLIRKNPGFDGIVVLKDGVKLAKIFDIEALKEFSGFQLKGFFSLAGSFKGEIEGQGAYLKDYLIEAISAKVDYTPTQFKFKDILLQDPAGAIAIKECFGTRASSQDEWMIAIPLLKGQEIKPSFLRKKNQPSTEQKPFQIRQLALSDIKGKLTDLSSMKAQGTLFFTQRARKEPSLFDIPYALMKDLGLDLDLFTPVMGEIRVILKDGKVFFADMQNTFSEGKRSEFSLANEPSFIDLDGRLFLNFRMRQNAALKLAEPFMILVRGTWEKPKYSLN